MDGMCKQLSSQVDSPSGCNGINMGSITAVLVNALKMKKKFIEIIIQYDLNKCFTSAHSLA
jgi:hypothetical protein